MDSANQCYTSLFPFKVCPHVKQLICPLSDFDVIIIFQRFHFDEDEEEEGGGEEEIEVFPSTHCDRYMMRLVDFKLKMQANLAEEGLGQKFTNVRLPLLLLCVVDMYGIHLYKLFKECSYSFKRCVRINIYMKLF